jgi:tRNA A37 N6-isopentenylltransferase MiaA
MYSNFKTCTNVSPKVFQNNDRFFLYHSVDFFEKRLTPVDYRKMVQEVINKVPGDILIEGGSIFYLKYLFKDGADNFDDEQWNKAKDKANQLLASKTDWADKYGGI